MRKEFCIVIGLLAAVMIPVLNTYADSFEFLTFTPPPGWVNQASAGGIAYRRASGIGLISFYPATSATGSDSEEFSRMWRSRVEPHLPGPAPQPQFQREAGYVAVVGSRVINAKEGPTSVSLVVFVASGRSLGVFAMATGEAAIGEVGVFFDGIRFSAGKQPDSSGSAAGSTPDGEIEVEFSVPPGYASKREGRMVLLVPTTINEKTPCAYGISPSRPSSGNLEADARAALLEPHPGWQLKDDNYNAMRGTAADGWKYFWFRTIIQSSGGEGVQSAYAMAMAFPAAAGRVNIAWGVGNVAHCMLDDISFSRLFHSLRPRGWTSSDGGKAFLQELQGTWRYTHPYGLTEYKFMPDGRYEHNAGASTTFGMLETTSSKASGGNYKLNGADLTLIGGGAPRLRVRVYQKYLAKGWWPMLSLLNEAANPPLEVEYERVGTPR